MALGRKRLLAFLLALVLCLALFPAALAEDAGTIAPAEEAEEPGAIAPADGTETVYTGTCGDKLNWSFDDSTGVLTITGTGDMYDYGIMKAPWYSYNSSITAVELPDGLTSIGNGLFFDCKMQSLTIPEGVTRIGNQAFLYCFDLQSVTLPKSLTSIGWSAFAGCSKLESLTIPKGVTSIGDNAFGECSSLPAINVAAENNAYSSRDGILYDKAQTTLLQCPAGKSGVIEVPDGVTAIGSSAFSSCKMVTGVTLPETLTAIGYLAFTTCEGLTSITFPASVTSIGGLALNGCYALKEIRFEGPAPSLSANLFSGMTATVYYPGVESSWTREVRDNCGGNITWIPTPNPFDDVIDGKYYYVPVLWAYYHDPLITAGLSDTSFGPGKTCTRAQIVTFLWRAAGAPEPTLTKNPFVDVKSDKYYYKAVLWASENLITSGVDDTHFAPDAGCTRAQVVSFLWRFAGTPAPTTTENPFRDVDSGKYYYKAVLWASENKITSGLTANTFGPVVTCTRGQIVTFLYNYMEG